MFIISLNFHYSFVCDFLLLSFQISATVWSVGFYYYITLLALKIWGFSYTEFGLIMDLGLICLVLNVLITFIYEDNYAMDL